MASSAQRPSGSRSCESWRAGRLPPGKNQSLRACYPNLGRSFRRVPAAPVIPATQPEPRDVEILLAGAYVPPERIGATWRVLETLAQAMAWGSTR